MFGFIPVAWKRILAARIYGTNEVPITLSPKLVLTSFGTNDVRIPERVCPTRCSVVIVVVVVLILPEVVEGFTRLFVSWIAPDQESFQEFQMVPKLRSITPLEAWFVNVSYEPGIWWTKSGRTVVSSHSSPSGLNVIFPIKSIVSKGFKFTVVLAYGWSINVWGV